MNELANIICSLGDDFLHPKMENNIINTPENDQDQNISGHNSEINDKEHSIELNITSLSSPPGLILPPPNTTLYTQRTYGGTISLMPSIAVDSNQNTPVLLNDGADEIEHKQSNAEKPCWHIWFISFHNKYNCNCYNKNLKIWNSHKCWFRCLRCLVMKNLTAEETSIMVFDSEYNKFVKEMPETKRDMEIFPFDRVPKLVQYNFTKFDSDRYLKKLHIVDLENLNRQIEQIGNFDIDKTLDRYNSQLRFQILIPLLFLILGIVLFIIHYDTGKFYLLLVPVIMLTGCCIMSASIKCQKKSFNVILKQRESDISIILENFNKEKQAGGELRLQCGKLGAWIELIIQKFDLFLGFGDVDDGFRFWKKDKFMRGAYRHSSSNSYQSDFKFLRDINFRNWNAYIDKKWTMAMETQKEKVKGQQKKEGQINLKKWKDYMIRKQKKKENTDEIIEKKDVTMDNNNLKLGIPKSDQGFNTKHLKPYHNPSPGHLNKKLSKRMNFNLSESNDKIEKKAHTYLENEVIKKRTTYYLDDRLNRQNDNYRQKCFDNLDMNHKLDMLIASRKQQELQEIPLEKIDNGEKEEVKKHDCIGNYGFLGTKTKMRYTNKDNHFTYFIKNSGDDRISDEQNYHIFDSDSGKNTPVDIMKCMSFNPDDIDDSNFERKNVLDVIAEQPNENDLEYSKINQNQMSSDPINIKFVLNYKKPLK